MEPYDLEQTVREETKSIGLPGQISRQDPVENIPDLGAASREIELAIDALCVQFPALPAKAVHSPAKPDLLCLQGTKRMRGRAPLILLCIPGEGPISPELGMTKPRISIIVAVVPGWENGRDRPNGNGFDWLDSGRLVHSMAPIIVPVVSSVHVVVPHVGARGWQIGQSWYVHLSSPDFFLWSFEYAT